MWPGRSSAASSSSQDAAKASFADLTGEQRFSKLLEQERVIQSAAMQPDEVPSCMTLFDRWAMCFALWPQFRNVYRYGTFNDCAPKLDDFKFCLTLRGQDATQRREAFVERKAHQMATRRMPGGDTSEEVWSMRTNPIVDPAFVDESFLPGSQRAQSQEQHATKG
ncbi:unnamed protein product [Jaminaea pallidilutea]